MGGGCFKAPAVLGEARFSNEVALLSDPTTPSADLTTELSPVVQAAKCSSIVTASTLDVVLTALGTAASPGEVGHWFRDWLAKNALKCRLGLLSLLQRVAVHVLQAKLDCIAGCLNTCGDTAADFEHVCTTLEEKLRLEPRESNGMAALVVVADHAACMCVNESRSGIDSAEYLFGPLDQIVLLFSRAIFADIAGGSIAGRLQRWHECLHEIGLPPLESHLILLSCSAKSVLLSLLLVADDTPPAQVVTSRDSCVLVSMSSQLPDARACILSPYFESSTGTKTIRGQRVEGGEGHGPRKEFFITMGENVTKAAGGGRPPPLFSFYRGSGQYWFSAYASDLDGPGGDGLRARFRCFGQALVLAVLNHCRLSFALPSLFFSMLLQPHEAELPPPSLEHIALLDSALYASLKKCAKMRNADFKALKEASELPPEMSRDDYVAHQVANFMCMDALRETRAGFWEMACNANSWRGVQPADLRQIVCPLHDGDALDVRQTFNVVEEELAECPAFSRAVWAVIDGLALVDKRRFLSFVTGVEASPEPRMEQLTIQLPFCAFSKDEHAAMLDKLPQAHTCSNTLELPSYHEALLETGVVTEDQGSEILERELQRIFREKLLLAIRETSGYELDAVDCDGNGGTGSENSLEDLRPAPQGVAQGRDAIEHAALVVSHNTWVHDVSDTVTEPLLGDTSQRATEEVYSSEAAVIPMSEVTAPAKRDFQSFLNSLAEPVERAPVSEGGGKIGIDSLINELDHALYEKR